MKKITSILFCFIMILSLASCSVVDETDAKDTVETLIKYIEQGDYDSAADLFCGENTEGKIFSEFLNDIENSTKLDLQEEIELVKCISFESKYSGSYGTIPCAFLDYQITIGNHSAVLDIDIMENDDKLEVFFFNLEYEGELYQYYCETE